jgi:hypothetical protein
MNSVQPVSVHEIRLNQCLFQVVNAVQEHQIEPVKPSMSSSLGDKHARWEVTGLGSYYSNVNKFPDPGI